MPRILFVSGFHPATRARDLAFEFERFGQLIRCDVPAPRNPHATHNPYAFVEFRSNRDAEDAYYDMHGKHFEGSRLSIQWAKNPPSSVWRYDRGRTPPPSERERGPSGGYRSRGRSRSRTPPRRSGRDDRDRRDRRDDRDRDRDRRDDRDRERRRSRSGERRRSASPPRRRDDRDRDRERDRARTPPPLETNGVSSKEDTKDRAQTPPYDH